MALAALLRPLAALWVALGLVAALVGLAAFGLGERHLAPLFGVTMAVGLAPGSLILAATRSMPVGASALDALVLGLLAWITIPLLAAVPFYLSGYFDAVDSLFEAYSAVTTTGAILLPPEDLPRSLVLWRAVLSWLGGYATVLLAIAVFAALDRDIPAIRRSTLLTVQADDVLSHLRLAATRIFLVYAVLTSIIWAALILTGNTPYEAITLAFGSISTGGYAPFSGGLEQHLSAASIMLIMLGCLIGAVNFSLYWDALRDRTAWLDIDLAGLAIMVSVLAAFFIIASPGQLFQDIARAVFVVTTAGYAYGTAQMPVLVAAIFMALIGGAAGSTTGGIKISRIMLLWRRMGVELATLADPSLVQPMSFRDRPAPDRALIAIWSYVLAFLFALGIGTMLLTLAGLDFEHGFIAMAAALANIGPLYQEAAVGWDWEAMSDAAKLVLIPAMILGRLEVLAALAAVWALFIRK
ncbi:potassium transporter TrkG [Maricaulis sp.]|uniref:potassium transporter TrkG n=1 Tax=Maricaulis sp. TaxID=1486257 RepID=UPI003A8C97FC